jgi:hypothetical protein
MSRASYADTSPSSAYPAEGVAADAEKAGEVGADIGGDMTTAATPVIRGGASEGAAAVREVALSSAAAAAAATAAAATAASAAASSAVMVLMTQGAAPERKPLSGSL